MTKMKSKKMTKSTFAIIIMAIAMVAMLAFGGTYAYFTASTAAKATTVTTGTVSLKSNSALQVVSYDRNVVPGDPLFTGDISYTSESTVDTYVVVKFSFSATRDGSAASAEEIAALKEAIAFETESDWTATTADATVFVYKNGAKLAANHASAIPFIAGGIKIDENYDENKHEGATTGASIEGLVVTISVQAAAIQADNITVGAQTADAVWTAVKDLVTFPVAE